MRILDGGLVTTVQDTGRYGHYHIGMPPSGAMDQFAHPKVGNWLVGNDESDATLEMTYMGAEIEFEEDIVFAVTGADMDPSLEDEPIPTWTAVQVEAGDTLSFGFATEGARAYLAVAGGIDIEPVMGSRATYTLIGIGGHEGRSLEEGDELPVGESSADTDELLGTPIDETDRPDYSQSEINVVMGLCDYRLTDEGRQRFLDADWNVSDEADRVGYRFEGPDITDMFEEREQPFGAGTDVTNVVDPRLSRRLHPDGRSTDYSDARRRYGWRLRDRGNRRVPSAMRSPSVEPIAPSISPPSTSTKRSRFVRSETLISKAFRSRCSGDSPVND